MSEPMQLSAALAFSPGNKAYAGGDGGETIIVERHYWAPEGYRHIINVLTLDRSGVGHSVPYNGTDFNMLCECLHAFDVKPEDNVWRPLEDHYAEKIILQVIQRLKGR